MHMHRRTSPSAEAQLQDFLTNHLEAPQRDDVGALLGQVMLFLDRPAVGEPEPIEWREAVSAALSGDALPESRRQGRAVARSARPH
jgi:hypothetical protein